MSSRLFQEVREKRGLCYSVFSFASAYEDAGQFGVYAATSPDDTPELVDVTADVMLSTAKSVTEIEVARAKAQLKASLVMSLESATGRADQIARQFLAFGEVPAMETLVAKIDAVSADHVAGLASALFRGQSPALSAVGQLSTLTPYAKIKAQFS
jgi:predicted Zn-dependent peptidase